MNPQAFNRYSYCINNPLKYIDPSGRLVMVNGMDINAIDYLLMNPELYAMAADSEEFIETITSEEYQTYTGFRESSGELAENLEEADTVYEVGLPASETSTSKGLIFYSRIDNKLNYYGWNDSEVYIPYDNSLNVINWDRTTEVLSGYVLVIGGGILVIGTIIVAAHGGIISFIGAVPFLYTEIGFITEGIQNKRKTHLSWFITDIRSSLDPLLRGA